jgi:hypothetical protein
MLTNKALWEMRHQTYCDHHYLLLPAAGVPTNQRNLIDEEETKTCCREKKNITFNMSLVGHKLRNHVPGAGSSSL